MPAIHPLYIFTSAAFVAMATFLFRLLVQVVRKDTALTGGRSIPVPLWELTAVLLLLTAGLCFVPPRMVYGYMMAAMEVGMVAVIVWRRNIPVGPMFCMPWPLGSSVLRAMWIALGLTLISGYLYSVNEMLCKALDISSGEQDLRTFILTSKDFFKMSLVFGLIIFVAPAAEEILMRGLVQSSLRQYFSPLGAILVTSVIFAALHLTPVAFLSLMFNSIAFGIAYERKGSLPFNICLHGAFNTVFVIVTFLERFFGRPSDVLPIIEKAAKIGVTTCEVFK